MIRFTTSPSFAGSAFESNESGIENNAKVGSLSTSISDLASTSTTTTLTAMDWTIQQNWRLLKAKDKCDSCWELVSQEMKTGHLPEECREHYYYLIGKSVESKEWTQDEEDFLKDIINEYPKIGGKMKYYSQMMLNHIAWTFENRHSTDEINEKCKLLNSPKKASKSKKATKSKASKSKKRKFSEIKSKIPSYQTLIRDQKISLSSRTLPEQALFLVEHSQKLSESSGKFSQENLKKLFTEIIKRQAPYNWEEISSEFNGLYTARECSQTYYHYMTKLGRINKGYKEGAWSNEEDQLLVQGMEQFQKNWSKISSEIFNGQRTPEQCCNRSNCMKLDLNFNTPIKKYNWNSDETERLRNAILEFGTNDWSKIAEVVATRTISQCKFKYQKMEHKELVTVADFIETNLEQDGDVETSS